MLIITVLSDSVAFYFPSWLQHCVTLLVLLEKYALD